MQTASTWSTEPRSPRRDPMRPSGRAAPGTRTPTWWYPALRQERHVDADLRRPGRLWYL